MSTTRRRTLKEWLKFASNQSLNKFKMFETRRLEAFFFERWKNRIGRWTVVGHVRNTFFLITYLLSYHLTYAFTCIDFVC